MERSPHSDLHGAGPAYRAGVSLSAPWGRNESGGEQPARSETRSGGCRSRTGCSLRSRALAGRLTHHDAVPSRTAVEGEGFEPSRSASRRSALSSNQAPTPIGVMPFYRGRCARSRTWLIGFGDRPRRRTLFARTYQKRCDSRRKEGESNPQGSSLGRAPDGSRRPSACPSVVQTLCGGRRGSRTPKAHRSPWFEHGAVSNRLALPSRCVGGAAASRHSVAREIARRMREAAGVWASALTRR